MTGAEQRRKKARTPNVWCPRILTAHALFSPTQVLEDQQNIRLIRELLQTLYTSLCTLVQRVGKSVLVGNINMWVYRMETILHWQQQLNSIQITRVSSNTRLPPAVRTSAAASHERLGDLPGLCRSSLVEEECGLSRSDALSRVLRAGWEFPIERGGGQSLRIAAAWQESWKPGFGEGRPGSLVFPISSQRTCASQLQGRCLEYDRAGTAMAWKAATNLCKF